MGKYNVSVLGFGDNVVDVYQHAGLMYPGGNAVNFAVYARRLGVCRSAYMGFFGSDEAAEHVISSLGEEGVETYKCRQLLGENGYSVISIQNGDRVFLDYNEGGIRGENRFVLDRFDLEYLKGFDLVHSGSYCFTERQLPKLQAAGVPVSFDFSDDSSREYYRQVAPYVTYAFLSASHMTEGEVQEHLKWVASLGPAFVCASRGGEGCIAWDGQEFYRQPAAPVDRVVDTMGAGDGLLTAFLVRYLAARKEGRRGREVIARCLAEAAAFAAEVCSADGAWGHGKPYR